VSAARGWGIILCVFLTGCPPPCGGEGEDCCEDNECSAGLACAASTMTCEDVEPLFPASYRDEYTMVRDCRTSIEHDLVSVRVWANPAATGPYQTRTGELPDGALLVKEEYSDRECTDLIGFTVMRREAGYAPAEGDWHWQSVAFDRNVVEDGVIFECFACHLEDCGLPPEGFDGTCAIPP
jgi:hypothetical protein